MRKRSRNPPAKPDSDEIISSLRRRVGTPVPEKSSIGRVTRAERGLLVLLPLLSPIPAVAAIGQSTERICTPAARPEPLDRGAAAGPLPAAPSQRAGQPRARGP